MQDMRNSRNTKPSNFHVSFLFQDVLTLIGEALRSFPKPSEDPRNLWQRLKGQEMQGLKVVNITQGHKEPGEPSAGSYVLNDKDCGCSLFCR